MTERNPEAGGKDGERRTSEEGRQRADDSQQQLARIERVGKCLFGVAGCTVVLRDGNVASYEDRQVVPSALQQFCAQLPVTEELLVVPAAPSMAPGQAPLAAVDNMSVHFYAVQPVRDSEGQVVGSVCLIHERPRAFPPGDRQLLSDLAALVERELHVRFTTNLHADLQKTNRMLRRKSLGDPMTCTWNRAAIMRILAIEAVRCKKLGVPLVLIVADLDHLKQVNDTHGQAAGDAVLAATANCLRVCMRPQDALGRYGGEEFLAILPGATQAAAHAVAERMRQAMAAQPVQFGPVAISITISAGVVGSDQFVLATTAELISRADTAMYAAKEAGRNQVLQALPPADN